MSTLIEDPAYAIEENIPKAVALLAELTKDAITAFNTGKNKDDDAVNKAFEKETRKNVEEYINRSVEKADPKRLTIIIVFLLYLSAKNPPKTEEIIPATRLIDTTMPIDQDVNPSQSVMKKENQIELSPSANIYPACVMAIDWVFWRGETILLKIFAESVRVFLGKRFSFIKRRIAIPTSVKNADANKRILSPEK